MSLLSLSLRWHCRWWYYAADYVISMLPYAAFISQLILPLMPLFSPCWLMPPSHADYSTCCRWAAEASFTRVYVITIDDIITLMMKSITIRFHDYAADYFAAAATLMIVATFRLRIRCRFQAMLFRHDYCRWCYAAATIVMIFSTLLLLISSWYCIIDADAADAIFRCCHYFVFEWWFSRRATPLRQLADGHHYADWLLTFERHYASAAYAFIIIYDGHAYLSRLDAADFHAYYISHYASHWCCLRWYSFAFVIYAATYADIAAADTPTYITMPHIDIFAVFH